MTFEQSSPPTYQVAVKFEDGKLMVADHLQRNIALFANEWMVNIREQQF